MKMPLAIGLCSMSASNFKSLLKKLFEDIYLLYVDFKLNFEFCI